MKIKGIKISVLILMAILSLTACKKDSRVDDGVADVYVKAVLLDGQPVFGLVHYVMGYSAISTVTVSMPDQTVDQLSAYESTNTIFYAEPSPLNGSYSASVPDKGVYKYGVKFTDGVEKVISDELEEGFILPPTITSLTKSLDNSKVTLSWASLSGAQYYQFNILRAGETVFASQVFSLTTAENYVDIPISLIPSFSNGNYTFELNAFKYQTNNNGKLQATSSASADVDL